MRKAVTLGAASPLLALTVVAAMVVLIATQSGRGDAPKTRCVDCMTVNRWDIHSTTHSPTHTHTRAICSPSHSINPLILRRQPTTPLRSPQYAAHGRSGNVHLVEHLSDLQLLLHNHPLESSQEREVWP